MSARTATFPASRLLLLAPFLFTACNGGSPPGAGDDTGALAAKLNPKATRTGQGIMANLLVPSSIALDSTQIWHFDEALAATYFTHYQEYSPTVSCSGSSSACASTNQPGVPSAPAPSAVKFSQHVKAADCAFLDGGSLPATFYYQPVTIKGKNGQGNWTFSYRYEIAAPQPVAPFTAWVLFQETGGGETAPVSVGADVAGLSAQSSSQHPLKYSFSLAAADGTNRVQGLALSVDGSAVATPGSTLVQNCAGCLAGDAGALDFLYQTNAGTNGDVSLLTNGDARGILNGDLFAGNNDGGADGAALAKASMDPVTVNLAPGTHDLLLTGVVKGNDLVASQSFSVSGTVHVITPGCNGQGQD
jgi:hypothetical protein